MVKGINESPIVNPFAQPILTLTIDDQGNSKIETQMPAEVVVKIVTQAMLGTMFAYIDQMALAAQQGKLKTTNLV